MSYYVTNENSFLDIKNAHLRVTGNVHTDVLKVGSIGFQPVGSNISGTVNFTNVTTGVTTSSNLDVGGTLNLGTIELSASTHTLDHITARGNVTSTTVQFDNDTTGLVTTANVEVGGDLTVSGGVVSNVNLLSVSNVASIKKDSNVVTEFPRSKKLIKYPRVYLTSASQDGYKVTASHEGTSPYSAWEAFDANGDAVGWHSNDGSGSVISYNGTGGLYSGTTRLATETELGEWLGLELPEAIKLQSLRMVSQSYSPVANTIDNFVVYAKKQSGDTWTSLGVFTGVAAAQTSAAGVTVNVDANDYYKFFAIVATKRDSGGANTGVSIRDLAFFGTPEYDPEADGVDVVVKSVPNVPNTDWLEVYYDAKDYTSVTTTVDNKTGVSAQDATITNSGGTITFNDEYKAWTFGGTDPGPGSESTRTDTFIATMPSSFSGNQVHSVSTWFRYEQTFGDDAIFSISPSSGEDTNKSIGVRLNVGQDFQILYYHWSNDIRVNFPHGHTANTWYHMVVTYTGSITDERRGKSVYINGELCPFVSETTTGELNLDGGDQLQLARRNNGTKEFFGSIANFRVFNRALTSDEIWQLYAYQKEYFGHGDLGMTLKAGRLGIGTSEPRAMLDVRGDIYGGCPVFFHATRTTHAESTSSTGFNPLIWQSTRNNKGGGYSTTTGKFTAPIAGYYEFIYGGMSVNTGDTFELIPRLNNVRYVGPIIYSSADSSQNHRYATATAIVEMQVGDTWHLEIPAGANGMYGVGNAYNMFTGKFLSY